MSTLQDLENQVKELNPYGGWCPVQPGTEVRIKSALTTKSIDYAYDHDGGKPGHFRNFHLWATIDNSNQKWVIESANGVSFRFRHADSNQYLVADKPGENGRVFTWVNGFGSFFTFEDLHDGTVRIHLAEMPQYTLQPESVSTGNETRLTLWPHGHDDYAKWQIKAFHDLS